MQFSIRNILALMAVAAVLSWLASLVVPNWHLPSLYAGYGLDGYRASNQVSYLLGRSLWCAWYVAAFTAVLSGAAIAVVALSHAKGR